MPGKEQWALVTGGSSGIGFWTAKILAEKYGYALILVSSSRNRLETAAGRIRSNHSIVVFEQDLCRKNSAEKIYAFLKEQNLSPEILVNAAGIGYTGCFEKIPPEKEESLLLLNIQTPAALCRLFAEDRKEKGGGRILNVASIGAFTPGPFTAAYYASKSFLLSFSAAIRNELAPFGISVSALCPGTVNTAFFQKQHLKTPRFALDPEICASAGIRGMMRNKPAIIPGFWVRASLLLPVRIRMDSISKMKKKQDTCREEHNETQEENKPDEN